MPKPKFKVGDIVKMNNPNTSPPPSKVNKNLCSVGPFEIVYINMVGDILLDVSGSAFGHDGGGYKYEMETAMGSKYKENVNAYWHVDEIDLIIDRQEKPLKLSEVL